MTPDEHSALSWEALAQKLGVTRQSLVNWRPMDGAPQDRDPAKWEAWIKEKGVGVKGRRGSELKDEKTRHEIELLKAKIDREHRRVIDREEVNRLLLHISTRARTMLYQFLETEAPPKLDGMSAAAMRPMLREMADSIADEMADLADQFKEQ